VLSIRVALATTGFALSLQLAASGAEIKVLAGSAIQPAMNEIIPGFETRTGHRVVFDYGTVGGMAQRALRGERADAVVVSGPQMGALEKEGKVLAGTRLDLGKIGVGAFVRKGAPKPDIASVESFKRAMLAAKSVGYNDPAAGAPVGIYLLDLFERLGIANQMNAKTTVFKQRSDRFEAVARGDVEIGFNQISEIIAQPTVDLIAPLPESIQNYTTLAVGVLSSGEHQDAAKELIAFLSTPEVTAHFMRSGFQAIGDVSAAPDLRNEPLDRDPGKFLERLLRAVPRGSAVQDARALVDERGFSCSARENAKFSREIPPADFFLCTRDTEKEYFEVALFHKDHSFQRAALSSRPQWLKPQ